MRPKCIVYSVHMIILLSLFFSVYLINFVCVFLLYYVEEQFYRCILEMSNT